MLILVGGAVGLFDGRLIAPHVQEGLLKATGVSVIFIGLAGALQGMLSINNGELVSGGNNACCCSSCAWHAYR